MKKRSDGRYRVTLSIKGQKQYFYGKTKTEAAEKRDAFIHRQNDGIKFSDAADEWWTETEKRIAANSTKCYKPAVERAKDHYADALLKDIQPQDIYKLLSMMALTNKRKTIATQRIVLNGIFSRAVQQGYVLSNPVRDVRSPEGKGKVKVSMPPQSDIDAIKRSVDCTIGLLPYMAIYTGMRRGELLALTWEDIDLDKRIIHITKSLHYPDGKPAIKAPKTAESAHPVPILDKLLPVLTERKGKGIVFRNAKGKYLTEGEFQNRWKHYKAESGYQGTVHQLRHAYATMLYEAGIEPSKMQILLRHAQLSTTMDVYRDIRSSAERTAFEAVYAVDFETKEVKKGVNETAMH